ncbi:MAG: preprotein translocase subunit SecE [Planctomycetes bacterium RBG_13_46_10]|nr:MAG: preprotein translocase subunit SecE [Planctomycetes bacterium RBG_13_46_10]
MFFRIYKPGQGKYTRICTAISAAVIVGFGCLRLYRILQAFDWQSWWGPWIESMIPAILFAVLGILIFYLVNRPAVADFLIAGEGEIKKVNWSSRREIAVSTFIVIVVVVVMAILLGTTDFGFRLFFDWFFA